MPSGSFQDSQKERQFCCLPGLVVSKIVDYLSISCLFTFASTVPSLYLMITHVISRRLKDRLDYILSSRSKKLFNRLEQIALQVEEKSIAVSGSTIVQVLLGKRWENSDIDIYCTKEAAPKVRCVFAEIGLLLVHSGLENDL